MKRYDICVPKSYKKDGEDKTQWNRVGRLVRFDKEDGSTSHILELHMFPETRFAVFEEKPRSYESTQSESVPIINADSGEPF